MKNNLLTSILLGVLAISALASVVLCWAYAANAREIRSLNSQVALINTRRAAINALANDALEYSKRNPAIDPILETFGVKSSKAAPAATAKSPTK